MSKIFRISPPSLSRQIDKTNGENQSLFDQAKKLTFCSTPESRQCLPFNLAQRLTILPLAVLKSSGRELLLVAAKEDVNPELVSTLRFATEKDIKLVKADEEVLPQAIFIAYHQDQALLQQRIKSLPTTESHRDNIDWDAIPLALDDASTSPALLLAALIKYCLAQQASDLHLIPCQDGTQVSVRINGTMQQYAKTIGNRHSHEQLINRIKILARLNTVEKRTPQDGAMHIDIAKFAVSIRVSTMPTIFGQKAVLRFLGQQRFLGLDKLGLDRTTYIFIEKYLRKAQGAVIFAGSTGSGKTTTMYAMLEKFVGKGLNIITIEDPVEIKLPGISQTSLDQTVNLDYTTCLRSVLRQDPDVILLGEIRDTASATTALQAALTGHALLSTVHARNVFEVLLRLHNLKIDYLTIAQALQLVICQRLFPTLCEHCKIIDSDASKLLRQPVYKPVGCQHCGESGYLGRTLATESLWIDSQVAELLTTETVQLSELKALTSPVCYYPFNAALERLLKSGLICTEQYFDNLQE